MNIFPSKLLKLAEDVLFSARAAGLRIATAESCTGGLVCAILTEIPGSSDVFDRGFITYSNDAKTHLLDVPAITINSFGAVSKETAHSMAQGALKRSLSQISIAITGIAGPGTSSETKPVGTVHFVCASSSGTAVHFHALFTGDRHSVRLAAVEQALLMLQAAVSTDS